MECKGLEACGRLARVLAELVGIGWESGDEHPRVGSALSYSRAAI